MALRIGYPSGPIPRGDIGLLRYVVVDGAGLARPLEGSSNGGLLLPGYGDLLLPGYGGRLSPGYGDLPSLA